MRKGNEKLKATLVYVNIEVGSTEKDYEHTIKIFPHFQLVIVFLSSRHTYNMDAQLMGCTKVQG
jgi:hypothetical protein